MRERRTRRATDPRGPEFRLDSLSRACSSPDRAFGSGPKGSRFDSCQAHFHRSAIEDGSETDGRFIGFVGFHHHRWFPDEVELGWRLDPAYWRRGLATEGACAALRAGLRELGFERVISVIHRDNVASRRVAAKLGMEVWREGDCPHPDGMSTRPIVVYSTRATPRQGSGTVDS